MKSILTLCVGNICRSPMAEGLLAASLPEIVVTSAGVGALIGHPADDSAIKLMDDLGIDISRHIAKQISRSMCQSADLILVMDNSQRRYIENLFPPMRGKIFLLNPDAADGIPDPYRKDMKYFEDTLSLIKSGIASWVSRVEKINEKERFSK